ncbi:MAG: DUF3606 domain-containing protein [Sphingobacteriales bacterium JAD_PAG50586_3]|nr:MAG: DUF3606 domain-containing protein [Sphingobacteriales bacterium JAD_PAG50586_3]
MAPKVNYLEKTWININDADEVAFWAKRFHVTPKEIVAAVAHVGKPVRYVEQHLEHKLLKKS